MLTEKTRNKFYKKKNYSSLFLFYNHLGNASYIFSYRIWEMESKIEREEIIEENNVNQ